MASNRNVAFVDGTPNSWPIPVVLCSCCGNEISRFEGAGPLCLKCSKVVISIDTKRYLKDAVREYPAQRADFFRQVKEHPEGMILVDKKEYQELIQIREGLSVDVLSDMKELEMGNLENRQSGSVSSEQLDYHDKLVDELKNLEDKNIEARKRIIESKGAVVNLNDLEKEGLIILCSDGSIISDDFQEAIQRGGYGLIRKEIDSTENLPAQSAIFVKLNN